jgi:broad specificity phosphatase PhoE
MAEVWFIRHGESAANAGEVVDDMVSVPLTQKGHEQSKKLSDVFNKAPDLIVTTPYYRTQQTAQPTRDRFPDAPHETWPLQEFAALCPANFNGTNHAQRSPIYKKIWGDCDPDYIDGEGAESFSAMVDRVKDALEKLRARPEAHIAVFTHGHIMRVTELMLKNPTFDKKQLMAAMSHNGNTEPVQNCGVMKLLADKDGVRFKPEIIAAAPKPPKFKL